MDPRFSEFMGEMREFKRMSLESFNEIKSEMQGLKAWKMKVAGGAAVLSMLVTGLIKFFEMNK